MLLSSALYSQDLEKYRFVLYVTASLRMGPSALYMPGEHYTTALYPQGSFCSLPRDGPSLYCQGRFRTCDPSE